ncbi:MAG: class I SAM-dependent methyltransferase [Bacteroidia bacterium]|jgi:SAM-dependent methyltransferase|nr:class I SAM-dependent methyltransferase [Bacteroidia bacterium]
MDWKQFWENHGASTKALDQVGRVGGTMPQTESFLKEYAGYIANTLQLTTDDVLLDVCCGNGILTSYLANYCKYTIGVDFSETHIDYANQKYANSSLKFVCADALQLDSLPLPFTITKATLCFSFQYFETVQNGLQVVNGIKQQRAQQLLLTDIPDRSRFFTYYHSIPKILRLVKQMVLQKNNMGKFWGEDELAWITKQLGGKGKKIAQPPHFPYATYRMDYLIQDLYH